MNIQQFEAWMQANYPQHNLEKVATRVGDTSPVEFKSPGTQHKWLGWTGALSVNAPQVVPVEVLEAVDRMSKPLHESVLSGATAQADARCMTVIKHFIDHLRVMSGQPEFLASPINTHRIEF